MEELLCNGTPAQVARRVLAVLAEDPNLVWQVSPQKERPTDLRDVLSRTQGLPAVDLPEDLPVIYIYVGYRYVPGQRTMGGSFTAEKLLDHTLLTASARVRQKTMYLDGRLEQSLVEDFCELAPIWEKVKAELIRLGLVSEVESTQVERVVDSPKPIAAAPIHDLLKMAPVNEEPMNLGVQDDEVTSDNPRSKLLQDLDKHFSEEDLRTLCFELGEDYENLPAQGKAGKARELILQLGRVGRVLELIDRCRKLRPNISW
jgi:hypothetical protein